MLTFRDIPVRVTIAGAVEFSDGLGPMERWRRAIEDPTTMAVLVQRLCDGEEMPVICKSRGWPYGKVMQWLLMDEERSRQFREAWRMGAYADVSAAKAIALGSDNAALAVATLWRGAEVKDSETFGKKMKVERSVTLTADAGLVGFAGDLLKLVSKRPEKVIESISVAEDDPI